MSDRPIVTFALFAYNQERYIREAVESALAQTYEPLEIILSDDCSTDRTFEVMQQLVDAYAGPHRVILNRNTVNLGVTGHVNHVVFDLSHGEIIVAAAGDDISFPHRTKTLMDAWHAHSPCSAITSGFVRIDASGKELDTVTPGLALRPTALAERMARLHRKDPPYMFGCTLSFRRDLFSFFGPLVIRYIDDGAIVARAGLKDGLVVIGDVLVANRIHAHSLTAASTAVDALQKFARMRQQTYLQILVDIGRLRGRTVEIRDRWVGLKTKIYCCLLKEDFVVWYLAAPRAVRVLLAPVVAALCGLRGCKEILASALPGAYRAFSVVRGRRPARKRPPEWPLA